MSRQQGNHYENIAKLYLTNQGSKLLCSNYQALCGEIDLIIKDKQEIAFVEVKHRKNNQFGGAIYTITKAKQRKIIRTAQHYLVTNKKYAKMPCRFDVLCIEGEQHIEWIKNAFIT